MVDDAVDGKASDVAARDSGQAWQVINYVSVVAEVRLRGCGAMNVSVGTDGANSGPVLTGVVRGDGRR